MTVSRVYCPAHGFFIVKDGADFSDGVGQVGLFGRTLGMVVIKKRIPGDVPKCAWGVFVCLPVPLSHVYLC